jgi:hypothetical protein
MKTIHTVEDLVGLPKPYQLQGADLTAVNFRNFDFCGANLRNANLSWTNLRGVNFTSADLRGANLFRAYLAEACLVDANLKGAQLLEADLSSALLRDAKMPDPLVRLPPVGQSFIGWKQVRGGHILKLEIPADSPRISTFVGTKCRAQSAKVLEAFTYDRNPTQKTVFDSIFDRRFVYTLGEVVKVYDFNNDNRVECAPGVHFFMDRNEAEDYLQ